MPSIAMPQNGPAAGFESGSGLPAHLASRITCLRCCATKRVLLASPRGVSAICLAGCDTETLECSMWARSPLLIGFEVLPPLARPVLVMVRTRPVAMLAMPSRPTTASRERTHTAARAARQHSAGSAGAQDRLMPQLLPFVRRPPASARQLPPHSPISDPRQDSASSVTKRTVLPSRPTDGPACRHDSETCHGSNCQRQAPPNRAVVCASVGSQAHAHLLSPHSTLQHPSI
jgi:hypothetical protein